MTIIACAIALPATDWLVRTYHHGPTGPDCIIGMGLVAMCIAGFVMFVLRQVWADFKAWVRNMGIKYYPEREVLGW
jgi:hypothetical protein